MPRATRIAVPVEIDPNEPAGDDLTDEEIEQASVGDLISIQGAEFENVSWSIWRHRTRQEMANDSSTEAMEWVADRSGQLHGTDLVEQIGGGTFNFRGYMPRSDGRGVRLKFNRTIAIAGPRKNFSAPAPVATPTPTPAGNGELSRGERLMLKMLRQMDTRIQRVEAQPAAAAPAPTSMKELAETLVMLKGLSAPDHAPKDPDIEVVKSYVGMIQQGIELGRERDPLPAGGGDSGPDWGKIAETGMQLLDRLLARAAQQRAIRNRPRPASSATVVEDPPIAPTSPAAATETPANVINHRWVAAVEKLASAIAAGGDPVELASDLEVILNDDELDKLALPMVTADMVLAEVPALVDRFPVLKEDRAKVFIEAVLHELRNPAEPA